MITLTPAAINEIKDVLKTEGERWIRISIKGGGCSGFNYAFDFAQEKDEDDTTVDDIVLIDSMSLQYLDNATVDYKEELLGSSFHIENPNASTTCGCGSSFSV